MKQVLTAALVMSLCFTANAQDADEQHEKKPVAGPTHSSARDWLFEVAMYGWLTALKADTTIGDGATSSIDASIGDVLDVLKFAGFAHAEARHCRWGFMTDLTYAKLGDAARVKLKRGLLRPGIKVDATLTETIVEAGLFRRFGNENCAFDLLGGARYFKFQTDIDVGPFTLDPSADWVDPFVGGRYIQKLGERWLLSLRGDLGGFGAGSDFSINAVAHVRYALSENIDAGFGYRYLDVDYDHDRLEYDSKTHGPVLGIAFKF